jgi:hypothetical protein
VAYTQADLDVIRAAKLRGELTVQFSDRSVTYRSIRELQAVEQDILHELQAAHPRSRQTYVVATKGL